MTQPQQSRLSTVHTQNTPLPVADKVKFITHVNEEHQDELAMFIEAFTDTTVDDDMSVQVDEVYTDGLLLNTICNNAVEASSHDVTGVQQFFIPFAQLIDDNNSLKSQYILLLQQAAKMLGRPSIKLQQRRFKVLGISNVSANMLRLQVLAPNDTPLDHPGYAYLFAMSVPIKQKADSSLAATTDTHIADKTVDKIVEKDATDKLQRYYTLRKAWQDNASQKIHAYIDIYLHGDTVGGNWARAAKVDTILYSKRDYPEKIAHLSQGQALLICDETSVPTVANLLERWQNLLPPIVIMVTHDPADIGYLDDIQLSERLAKESGFMQNNVVHINRNSTTALPKTIMTKIDDLSASLDHSITKVWGALEAKEAKALRSMLQTQLSLSRKDMVVKVYWRDEHQ